MSNSKDLQEGSLSLSRPVSSLGLSRSVSISVSSLGERFKSLLDSATTTGYQTNTNENEYEEIKSRCLVSAENRLKNAENQNSLKSLWKAQSEMETLVCVTKFRRSDRKRSAEKRIKKKPQIKIRFRCFPCRKKFNQFAKLLLHRSVTLARRGCRI